MLIQWITIAEFRNYRSLSFHPDPGLNVLSGPNAQGKTNLLEAMGVLLVGRSFRGAKAVDLPRWGAAGVSLSGAVARGDVAREIRRGVAQREDGGWAVTGEGCPWARAIPFGWQDLAILTGGPQARRNFLDGFAAKVQPAHRRPTIATGRSWDGAITSSRAGNASTSSRGTSSWRRSASRSSRGGAGPWSPSRARSRASTRSWRGPTSGPPRVSVRARPEATEGGVSRGAGGAP